MEATRAAAAACCRVRSVPPPPAPAPLVSRKSTIGGCIALDATDAAYASATADDRVGRSAVG